eukprot:gene9573-19895_t
MIQATICASLILSAGAFTQPTSSVSSSVRWSTPEPLMEPAETVSIPVFPSLKPKVALPAKWLPIGGVKAPIVLDGTLAGDVGFDPAGFAKSTKTLYWMREAENKHGRLAMLAAVGWPLSELWHKEIASAFGLPSILAAGDRAPSLLNGGLSSPFASGVLIMSIIIAGYLEAKAMNSGLVFWDSQKPDDYVPGDFGFDPFNLHNIRGNRKTMQTAEIKNGRLAMIAITAFAAQEFATGLPVVQETPYLF